MLLKDVMLAVVAFVPPLATARVPARVTAPDVAEAGVRPVVPPAKVVTLVVAALLANSLTVPALFLKYSFSSRVLSANSPATRFPAEGAAAAVVLKYSEIGVKPVAAIVVP
jgi:hypothetical protein